MATWTNVSKSSSSWTGASKATVSALPAGMPMGLLLAITYGVDSYVDSASWTNLSKSSDPSYSNQSKS